MATLILSAVGTLAGGPLGGVLGALVGRQVDRAIIGSPRREGPRLKELAVTTSSYGTPIARHHGRVRVPGSVIWATELAESSESTGAKGQPTITTYSYSVSFAVALSSRPIRDVGRIWADGNLLRGAAGDLKVGGAMRLYRGHGDQMPDPLIASDKGPACPAFRHTAYVVFEDLQLADFGNRIPALSFEVIADDGAVTLADMLDFLPEPPAIDRALTGLRGFSLEDGTLADTIATIGAAYPLALNAGASGLSLMPADAVPATIPVLPPPAAAPDSDGFGAQDGMMRTRLPASAVTPDSLRYYDVERDFLPGLQRVDRRARAGHGVTIDFPGTLMAGDARMLANAAAERSRWARETLAWRMAELDPALAPGTIVRVPGQAGNWQIAGWEWNDTGVELDLLRLPRGPARQPAGDPGAVLSPPDFPAAPTLLSAFELPWDGGGTGNQPALFVAASSAGKGWSGAGLYADQGGSLVPLGGSGSRRAIIGTSAGAIPSSPALLLEEGSAIEITLASADFALTGTTRAGLASGANRALLGGEIVQFLRAERISAATWRLSGLLRGRGGTEEAARTGHPPGAPFVLLDDTLLPLDPGKVGPSTGATITAIGLGDAGPVSTPIRNPGITLRPLPPVHPRSRRESDGSLSLRWTRRARGGWRWPDEVELPLDEQSEAYRVGIGPVDAPLAVWDVATPAHSISAAMFASLASSHPAAAIWVRQVGDHAQSPPLLLATLP